MKSKGLRWLIGLFFVGYTCCLLYWMFIGFGRGIHRDASFSYNLIPLRTIGLYLFHMDAFPWRVWVINLFGNMGVFMPFGICMPYLFRPAARYKIFILLFGCPLVGLEGLQMLLRVGSFDVDDLILNGLGASAAYAFYMHFPTFKRKFIGAE
ncbi:hypothetical protein GK047_16040 [Paenibacillus sp. SYP-B3998]|uniref:VanZ-like domain-containing protein n=1 Tax=Paenibacillus sp. SYP-B3998 TaxID=2678564 RepID=A0A6G4A1J7_9BACL|nr:VanZ family protein [Paenibacillus sp. SYP-B3998]NEW07517.1 hypothetical protein [Paenibacillus sp. SYP-B3998]